MSKSAGGSISLQILHQAIVFVALIALEHQLEALRGSSFNAAPTIAWVNPRGTQFYFAPSLGL